MNIWLEKKPKLNKEKKGKERQDIANRCRLLLLCLLLVLPLLIWCWDFSVVSHSPPPRVPKAYFRDQALDIALSKF